jgi:hypothetical protein
VLTTRLPSALLRRWYVTLAGLACTGALIFAVLQLAPPTYQSESRILLVPPVVKAGENPYLSLSGLREVSEVLGVSMSDDATLQSLKDAGLDGKFTVARDVAAAGPIIVVTGEADSSEQSMRNRDLAAAVIPGRLAQLQDNENIPRASRITSQTISVDKEGEADLKSLIRLLVVAVGLGLALTVGAVALTDRVLTRRREGRSGAGDAQDERADPVDDAADEAPDPDDAVTHPMAGAVAVAKTEPVVEESGDDTMREKPGADPVSQVPVGDPAVGVAGSEPEGVPGSGRRKRQRRRNGSGRHDPIDLASPPNGSGTSRDSLPLPQGWGDERASTRR